MDLSGVSTLPAGVQALLAQWCDAASPGILVSVSHQGRVLFEQAVGLAVVSNGIPINAKTNFRMASVTKQFTAVAVALLVQDGLVTFETTLSEVFPEIGLIGQHVTLRHLLTHTSGLPDYEPLLTENRQEQVRDQEVLQLLASQPSVLFPPGQQFWYSNTGYVLLGLVVEKISGHPFPEFVRERLFKPLGMAGSTFYQASEPDAVIEHRALGYAPLAQKQFVLSDQSPYSATQADGCLYTSLQDFRRWHQALFTHELVPLLSLLEKEKAPIAPGINGWYGMGWFFAPRQNGGLELYHSGNTCGFSHLVICLPEEQVLVTFFSNLADAPLLPDLLKALLPHLPFKLESDLIWQLPTLTR